MTKGGLEKFLSVSNLTIALLMVFFLSQIINFFQLSSFSNVFFLEIVFHEFPFPFHRNHSYAFFRGFPLFFILIGVLKLRYVPTLLIVGVCNNFLLTFRLIYHFMNVKPFCIRMVAQQCSGDVSAKNCSNIFYLFWLAFSSQFDRGQAKAHTLFLHALQI